MQCKHGVSKIIHHLLMPYKLTPTKSLTCPWRVASTCPSLGRRASPAGKSKSQCNLCCWERKQQAVVLRREALTLEGCPFRRTVPGLVPWTKPSHCTLASDTSCLIRTVQGGDFNQTWSWILLSRWLAILGLSFLIQIDTTLCQYIVKIEHLITIH